MLSIRTRAMTAGAAALLAASGTIAQSQQPFDFERYSFASYYGSASQDRAHGVAMGSDGSAYIVGETGAFSLPAGRTSAFGARGGLGDAFLVKLNPAGTAVEFSVVFGGSGQEMATSVAVAPDGSVAIAGWTDSQSFPTVRATQGASGGDRDAFLVVIDPATLTPTLSTYLGGSSEEYGGGVAFGGSGDVFVAGETYSRNFPATIPFDWEGVRGSFVARIDPSDGEVSYARVFSGPSSGAKGVAVDGEDSVYLPVNQNLVKLSADGESVIYDIQVSRYNFADSVALDSASAAYVLSGPIFTDEDDQALEVAKVAPDGGSLVYETRLPTFSYQLTAGGIAVDSLGTAYVATTESNGMETTSGWLTRLSPDGLVMFMTSPTTNLSGVAVMSGTVRAVGFAGYTGYSVLRPFHNGTANDAFVIGLKFPKKIKNAPVIESIEVRPRPNNPSKMQMVITGSNFSEDAKVYVGSSTFHDVYFNVKSSTSIVRKVAVNHEFPVTITVLNPDGGKAEASYQGE